MLCCKVVVCNNLGYQGYASKAKREEKLRCR